MQHKHKHGNNGRYLNDILHSLLSVCGKEDKLSLAEESKTKAAKEDMDFVESQARAQKIETVCQFSLANQCAPVFSLYNLVPAYLAWNLN